jgi:hypothetical protein
MNKAIGDNNNDNSRFIIFLVLLLSNATLTWNLMLPIKKSAVCIPGMATSTILVIPL